jgi:phosphoglycerate dehydrogenase-like enzyme
MILLLESMHPDAVALLERCEPVLRAADPNEPQTPSSSVRAIITRGRGRISAELMGLFPELRVIARSGAGLDNLDTDTAARRNIDVIYSPGMNAFGMKVIVARRRGKTFECEYPALPLDELLDVADVVSLHLPLTPETNGILGAVQIARMRGELRQRSRCFITPEG